MPSLHAKCPYIYSDDCLRLSQDLHLTNDTLTDKPLGVRHALQPAGRQLVALLAGGGSPHKALERSARKAGIPPMAVQEFLGFLNIIGGLTIVHRPLSVSRLAHRAYGRVFLGVHGASLAHRYPCTSRNLVRGLTGATWSLGAAICITSALFAVAGVLSWNLGAVYAAYSYLLFCITVYVHEAMHIRFIVRIHDVTRVVIIQRGIHLSIVHPPLPVHYERLSALAGPGGGIVSALGFAGIAVLLNLNWLAIIGVLVAAFHALSLLPWTSDGRYLFQTKAVQQGIL